MSLRSSFALPLFIAFVAFLPARAGAAPIVISTLSSWDGSSSIGDFGSAGFSAWGQFVTAPADTNRLTAFTFIVSDAIQGPPSEFRAVPVAFTAHVVQYDPISLMTVGPSLFSSGTVTVPVTDTLDFRAYTFSPNATVEAGSVYLLFLYATNYTLTIPDDSRLRLATAQSNYIGGAQNIPFDADSDFDMLLSQRWRFRAGDDLAFSATFDRVTVPEPGSIALVFAAAGAAAVRRVRSSDRARGAGGSAPRELRAGRS